MRRAIAALAVGALALTACGGGGKDANDVRVCQHYRTQRAYVKNLAEPTLAGAVKFAGWVAADAGQATPGSAVSRDLNAMMRDEQTSQSSYAASGRVLKDCEALGVTFQP